MIRVSIRQVDSILKQLGIDSLDTQDSLTRLVTEHLCSKNIKATVCGIRWNIITIESDAHNASLLRWEIDNITTLINASAADQKYTIKIKTCR